MFITTILLHVLSFQPSRKASAIRLKRTKPLLAVVEHFLRKVEGGLCGQAYKAYYAMLAGAAGHGYGALDLFRVYSKLYAKA